MAATLLLTSAIGLLVALPLFISVPSIVSAQGTDPSVEPLPVEPPPTEPPFEPPPIESPTNTPTVELTLNTPTPEPPTNTPTITPTITPTVTPVMPTISPTVLPVAPASTPTNRSSGETGGTTTTGSTRTSAPSTRASVSTDTNDPDYYLGRIDAWLTSEISAGDILRTDMADPQFGDAEWYIDQASAVGLILSIDAELQGLDQPSSNLDEIHQQVLAASSDHAAAAIDCDEALVSTDAEDATACQAAIEASTSVVQDLRDALAEWDGSDLELAASNDDRQSSSTVEPTTAPRREPRGSTGTAAAQRTATTTSDDEATSTEVAAETGSGEMRDSPLGVGRTGEVGDYEVTVISVTPDATDLVAAENQFNDPPAAGDQFFIARLSVTYIGSETGNPAFDLNYQSVGDSSTSYTIFNNSCGVYPEQSYNVTEVFEGGSAEFNVCWAIDRDDADSLLMYVEPSLSFNADPVWFSLDDPN